VGWKMNSWEVGRGVLGIVHGGSLGKRSLSGVTASCHWRCESGNVSSEECGSECGSKEDVGRSG